MVGMIEAARRDGVTVIVSTHDLAFVRRVADRVSLMFDGELACTEPVGEFFRNNLFYRRDGGDEMRLSGTCGHVLEIALLTAVPLVMGAALLTGAANAALLMMVVATLVLVLFFLG
ncbi:MAG: hypothetical protein ACLTSX_11480 [Collinsella sp.]